jgi:hypothetical protein
MIGVGAEAIEADDAFLLQDVPLFFEWVAGSCGVMSNKLPWHLIIF